MPATVLGFVAVFLLLFFGAPIAFGLVVVGFVGFGLIVGWLPALSMLGQIAYETPLTESLSVLPLFILMGNFITRAGLSQELYDSAMAFLGHRRGGLAMATVVACGGFAAVSGSSMATAATMCKVAMPSMRRYGYSDGLAAGSIAAGGTLGILIPPSVIFVIYGIMTSTDIGKLFVAGIVPGLVGIVFYIGAVALATTVDPKSGPRAKRVPWAKRFPPLVKIWGILALFVLVIGGIYMGVFTPTEAAGFGAAGAFLITLLKRCMNWRVLFDVLVETARTSSMMFVLLIGALIFSNFVNVAGMPKELNAWISSLHVAPIVIILYILGIYIILGCLLESLSMILLTVPIFFPIVMGLGYDPIWFGVIIVVVTEISLITPPIGLNVFVIKALLPEVPIGVIFKGVSFFILADIVRLGLLVFVPSLSLFLPSFMK